MLQKWMTRLFPDGRLLVTYFFAGPQLHAKRRFEKVLYGYAVTQDLAQSLFSPMAQATAAGGLGTVRFAQVEHARAESLRVGHRRARRALGAGIRPCRTKVESSY